MTAFPGIVRECQIIRRDGGFTGRVLEKKQDSFGDDKYVWTCIVVFCLCTAKYAVQTMRPCVRETYTKGLVDHHPSFGIHFGKFCSARSFVVLGHFTSRGSTTSNGAPSIFCWYRSTQ